MDLGMSISQLLLFAGPWLYLEVDMAHWEDLWLGEVEFFLLACSFPWILMLSVPSKSSREG